MMIRVIPLFAALIAAAMSPSLPAADKLGAVTISLPAETAQFKPGAGMDFATANCLICHSADYVYMQPPLSEAQWQAVVVKMKKVMGAPLPDADIGPLVKYLMTQNGKK